MNYLDNLTVKTSTPTEVTRNTNNAIVPAPNINLGNPKDSLCLYEMSEEMEKVEGYVGGGSVYLGELNGENSEIKIAILNKGTLEVGGTIGDKKLIMTTSDFGNKYKGNYNGKDFEIKATQDKKNEYIKKLSGQINGENFEIDFSKKPLIPKDKDTRDIVSLILFSNGNMPFIINGKISNIVMSPTSNAYFESVETKKEKNKNDYILPTISMIGGSVMTILTTLITNKLFSAK